MFICPIKHAEGSPEIDQLNHKHWILTAEIIFLVIYNMIYEINFVLCILKLSYFNINIFQNIYDVYYHFINICWFLKIDNTETSEAAHSHNGLQGIFVLIF